ncbi:MAG TPA: DNA-3-methyladenine glycosylase [Actinomycetota bacterium]
MSVATDQLPLRPVARAFFARPTLDVARDLIGCLLVHDLPEGTVVGSIVETEAYTDRDPGSHAFSGMTARNAPMFEEPGNAYVYFTYGMHHCLNAVTEETGRAGAVLLRAVEPIAGLEHLRSRRPGRRDRDLARGPGRLTLAFGIGREHDRADLTTGVLRICTGERLPEAALVRTARIGLAAAQQDGRRWRFAVKGSPWVSSGRSTTARGSRRS